MPNGEDKNWIRLCAAVDGFRARYVKWPTMIKVSSEIIDDIRLVLGEKMFQKVETHLKFIPDDVGFIAADDEGRQYDYAKRRVF